MPEPSWSSLWPRVCALAVCTLALAPLLVSAEPAGPCEIPLRVVACGHTTVDALPTLTIASLGPDYWKPAEIAAIDHGADLPWAGLWPEDSVLDHVVSRDHDRGVGPSVPFDDRDTVLLVSVRGRLRPLDIQRDGTRFRVRCEAIPSAPPASPQRELVALALGTLPAGDYRCDLDIAWRKPEGVPLHAIGSLPFGVYLSSGAKRPVPDHPPTITDAEMRSPLETSSPDGSTWQIPRSLTLAYGGTSEPGLYGVGPIDPATLGKEPVGNPVMPHGGGRQMAIVLGPLLNLGESIRLRSVTVTGGVWMVTVETWRDTGPRDKNYIHRELLAVPIDSPVDAPVPPKVVLTWRRLLAPQMGGCYREQPVEGAKGVIVSRDPLPGGGRSSTPAPAAPAAPAKPSTDF